MLSILKSLLATSDRRAQLLYANRDEASVIFRDELEALEAAYPDRLTVLHHLDRELGVVTAGEVEAFAGGVSDAEFFVCGPAPFMDTVEHRLVDAGVDGSRVHLERFTIDETESASAPSTPDHVDVTIQLGGRTVAVDYRRGATLLQTARHAGLRAPASCEIGTCGTCMARVVEGSAVMKQDAVLTPEELADGWVLTCQAIPVTPAVHVVYE